MTVKQPRPANDEAAMRPNAQAMMDALRAAVMNGTFLPGQRLVEAELMVRFAAGRGAVREALRRLADQGLVIIEPNKGASVKRSTRKELADIFEIRAAIEGMSARRAAERLDASGMRQSVEAALRHERAQEPFSGALEKMQANEALHAAIIDVAGNDVTGRSLQALMTPELRAVFFQVHLPDVWAASQRDHIALLEAILEQDAAAAEAVMKAHIARTAALVDSLPSHYLLDA